MPENKSGADTATVPVSLEILTGPARGTASWLSGTTLDISLNPTDMIRVAEVGSEPLENGVVARLHRSVTVMKSRPSKTARCGLTVPASIRSSWNSVI